nr:uncharacterized protein LOC128687132 [Cherax quadricarinatus]
MGHSIDRYDVTVCLYIHGMCIIDAKNRYISATVVSFHLCGHDLGETIVCAMVYLKFGRVWPVEVNKSSKNFLRRVNQCVLERQCDRSLAYIASQVTADEENYEDYLINSGSAIKINNLLPVKGLTDVMQKVAVNTGSEVYLTHVEGNGIVWLQCKVDSDVVLEIEEKIKTLLVKSKAPAEIAVGMPCIVQSSQDSWWYRALVKNIYEERVEVLCIDYGNSEAVHFSRVCIDLNLRACKIFF